MQNVLASDGTSYHSFLANHLCLYFSYATYVFHHTLRTETLEYTELSNAQPTTNMLKLFKLGVRVFQYKDCVNCICPASALCKH